MPLIKGRMLPDQQMKIEHNMEKLNENMDAKDLLDFFIQEEIFDFPDVERINGYSPNTRENRNRCFFELLFDSGPKAFNVFIQALDEQGQAYLVDMILKTEVHDTQTHASGSTDLTQWIHSVPKKRAILADKDLARLCNTLGENWELAMYALGLTQNDVWRSKSNNQLSILMQIYEALNVWKRKNYNQAHLERFVTVVGNCPGVNVDWDELKAVAMNM